MITIKKINQKEIENSLSLIWNVFLEYEGINTTESNQQAFYNAIHSIDYLQSLEAFGAYDNNHFVGIIATRNKGQHLALFFVKKEYQGQGIGRSLWNALLKDNTSNVITLHSSLYALPIYKKLGFIQMGDTQEKDGIQYVPMQYNKINEEIRAKLFEMQDIEYLDFHAKLIPTINKDNIIGVRTPNLRKYAKQIAKDPRINEFLNNLPHKYYDENNLHGFILEKISDFDKCIQAIDQFLPYVDNWATCDLMSPKVFKKYPDKLLPYIQKWLSSKETYTIRYGINMLMRIYLDKHFKTEYLQFIANIKSDEYYVKMGIAWYFQTALTKQYEATLPYIESQQLDPWIHNKIIQKAKESYQISQEHKNYLNKLKIKINKK
ncbi:MAG: GNAT family N-acetyltransferase [Traorella sp.]